MLIAVVLFINSFLLSFLQVSISGVILLTQAHSAGCTGAGARQFANLNLSA